MENLSNIVIYAFMSIGCLSFLVAIVISSLMLWMHIKENKERKVCIKYLKQGDNTSAYNYLIEHSYFPVEATKYIMDLKMFYHL